MKNLATMCLLVMMAGACQPAGPGGPDGGSTTASPTPTVDVTPPAEATSSAELLPPPTPTETASSTTPETTLVVAHGGQLGDVGEDPVLDAFVAANPEVAIELRRLDLDDPLDLDDLPHVAILPDRSVLEEHAREGLLVRLDDAFYAPTAGLPFLDGLLRQESVDATLVGISLGVDPAGFIWYSPAAFDTGGYEEPDTWQELIGLTDAIRAGGEIAPWCHGFAGSSPAAGAAIADLFSEAVLRTQGLLAHAQLESNLAPFDTPELAALAEELLAPLPLGPDGTVESAAAYLEVAPESAVAGVSGPEPSCAMAYGPAESVDGPLQRAEHGIDYDVFLLPPVEDGTGRTVAGRVSDYAAVYRDEPAALALAQHLISPATTAAWVAEGRALAATLTSTLVPDGLAGVDLALVETSQGLDGIAPPLLDVLPETVGLIDGLGAQLARWATGEITIQEALVAVDAQFDAIDPQ